MGFLGLFKKQPKPARFLEGRVGFAVGDVHGRADLLAQMFDLLEARLVGEMRDGAPPIVIFLGDYVDRGPNSAGVLDLLTGDRPHGYDRRYLRGNHEQSMLAFMHAPNENRAWLHHGGAETLASYGVAPPPPRHATNEECLEAAAALRARLPQAHRAFLESLERYVELGGYAFVHAGVDHGRGLDAQEDKDLYWSRERFLNSKRRFSHRVVHGHTPTDQPFADGRRIGVDTGAYATGVLTAARFEGEEVSFLAVTDRRR